MLRHFGHVTAVYARSLLLATNFVPVVDTEIVRWTALPAWRHGAVITLLEHGLVWKIAAEHSPPAFPATAAFTVTRRARLPVLPAILVLEIVLSPFLLALALRILRLHHVLAIWSHSGRRLRIMALVNGDERASTAHAVGVAILTSLLASE